MASRITSWDRLRSLRHGISLWISERTGRSHRVAKETPAGALTDLAPSQAACLQRLRARYRVNFEAAQDAAGALQAYEYLDLLDQSLQSWGEPPPRGLVMHAVGCASFAYASALVALFRPSRLTGVELEGYRRLRGGFNRAEKAAANVQRLPNTSFVIADYTSYAYTADLVIAFFPFVSPAPVLGWRLPLSVLNPGALFERIRTNLSPSGEFWMINHSPAEAATAATYAQASGMSIVRRHECQSSLRSRESAPVVSVWRACPIEAS